MSSFSAELRIDPADGNPYTLESFKKTYHNGEELWNAALPWKNDGILRIRTAPVAKSVAIIVEEPPVQAQVQNAEFHNEDFPSISPDHSSAMGYNGPIKYSEAAASSPKTYTNSLSDDNQRIMSPDAMVFNPGMETHDTLHYNQHKYSTNENFESLPASLWNGEENFPQPMTDEENGCVDWEAMIQTWTHEQWTEFGIKYFYGYIQQSSLLMGAMTMTEEPVENCDSETPLGAWGDE